MKGSYQQTKGAWNFYFLNETLIGETFTGIAVSLALCLLILALATGNPIMASYSVMTIVLVIVDVFAFTVIMGFKLGVLEAVNYVVVIGMSIDYCVHMSEAYSASHNAKRRERVYDMVEEMGVSVLSGACSTLGCMFFMFFAPNMFFFKFANFVTCTIVLSCIYSLLFFPALLSICGPEGDYGDMHKALAKYMANKKGAPNGQTV